MEDFRLKKIVTVFAVAVVCIPQKALAGLYESASWTAHSFYAGRMVGLPAPGIGGLQIEIGSQFVLAPSDIVYSNGYLRANYKGTSLTVPISQVELNESVALVQSGRETVFQTSLDSLAGGSTLYQSESLQKNTVFLAKLFGIADLEFAAMVQGRIPIPKDEPTHPYNLALQLLDTKDVYASLPTLWKTPPSDWPQLFLSFTSSTPGLVQMEAKPQVFFRSPDGHPVQVSDSVQVLGERPYTLLMQDVKKSPNTYRSFLPAVDRAASVTAALGIIRAGCQQPRSCRQLLAEPQKNELTKVREDYRNFELRLKKTSEIIPQNLQNLSIRWDELSLQPFNAGQNDQAWGAAYDAVQQNMDYTYKLLKFVYDAKQQGIKADEKTLNQRIALFDKSWELAAQQFLYYTVPNNAQLQAALAVVLIQTKGDENLQKAINVLDQAVKLSANAQPGDMIDVAKMGLYVGNFISIYKDEKLGKQITEKMKKDLIYAQIKAYKDVDSYLTTCMKSIASCSTEDLLSWEADTVKAGLYSPLTGVVLEYLKAGDVAWLYGRFSYLVGIKEPKWQQDRLRLLSSYVRLASKEHQKELARLEEDLRKGVASN
ncbi:hypothetical protein FACHB389_17775 [Nostoc calcicola FACHB-389]|nr:hypothetical protein [Nostoc calcicola FACHB-3891]OKH33637.1 hypothetical protein FACHB389_17775 [Nostoc calcicola FACHB-389]